MNTMIPTQSPADSFALEPAGADRVRATRRFAAPPAKLWRALTEPAPIRRWMETPTWPTTACEVDLRPGGAIRYAWGAMVLTGAFRELDPPTEGRPGRMAHTELFEPDWTDGETVCTTTLTADGEGTLLTMDILYSGPKGRDMALTSGREHGMREGYASLDKVARDL